MPLIVRISAFSHIGERESSKQNFYVNGDFLPGSQMKNGGEVYDFFSGTTQLYAVCEGYGDDKAAEDAALSVVNSLKKYHENTPRPSVGKALIDMMRRLSNTVGHIDDKNGVTGNAEASMAMLVLDDWSFRIVTAGNHNIFLLREGNFQSLTDGLNGGDDWPKTNDMTQTRLGRSFHAEEIVSERSDLEEGDRFIICSKTLTDALSPAVIERMANAEDDNNELTLQLVRTAAKEKEKNGEKVDNMTVAIADVMEIKDRKSYMRERSLAKGFTIAGVILLAIGAAGLVWLLPKVLPFLM